MACRYDAGGKGALDMDDLRHVLQALGLLSRMREKEQYVAAQMLLANKSGSGRLSFDEFCAYYSSLQFAGALLVASAFVHFLACSASLCRCFQFHDSTGAVVHLLEMAAVTTRLPQLSLQHQTSCTPDSKSCWLT